VRFLGFGHHGELFEFVNECDHLRIAGDDLIVLLDNLAWFVFDWVLVFLCLVVRFNLVHCLHLDGLQSVFDGRWDSVFQIVLFLLVFAVFIQDGHEGGAHHAVVERGIVHAGVVQFRLVLNAGFEVAEVGQFAREV
jgi:hypothetical protein